MYMYIPSFSKCSILFAIMVVIIIINRFNLMHLETRSEVFYQNKSNSKKVFDIFHNILPHIDEYEYAADILLIVVFLYMAFNNLTLVYTAIGYAISILLIRALFVNLTVLPKNEICSINNTSAFRGGCFDKIFSGHYAMTLLMTILLHSHKYINTIWFFIINIVNAIFILISRNHYTVDIAVSILVVILIYQNKLNICELLDKML